MLAERDASHCRHSGRPLAPGQGDAGLIAVRIRTGVRAQQTTINQFEDYRFSIVLNCKALRSPIRRHRSARVKPRSVLSLDVFDTVPGRSCSTPQQQLLETQDDRQSAG